MLSAGVDALLEKDGGDVVAAEAEVSSRLRGRLGCSESGEQKHELGEMEGAETHQSQV